MSQSYSRPAGVADPWPLLLALVAVLGCGDGLTEPGGSANLIVTVTGSGLVLDDQVTVLVDDRAVSVVRPGESGAETARVLVSSRAHTIWLDDLAPNCAGPGAGREVVVTGNRPTAVSLHVRCWADGSLAGFRFALATAGDSVMLGARDQVWVWGTGTSVALASDGSSIAVGGLDGGIRRSDWDLDDLGAWTVARLGQVRIKSLSWSPDGSRLAFVAQEWLDEEWTLPPVLTLATQLGAGWSLQSLTDWAFAPDWSPDGANLAAESSSGVVLFDPDGRFTGKLPVQEPYHLASPAFSPDGSRIALVRSSVAGTHAPESPVLLVERQTGAKTEIAMPWADYVSGVRWLPDGSGLMVRAVRTGGATVQCFYLTALDGSHPRLLAPCRRGEDHIEASVARAPGQAQAGGPR